MFHLLLVAFLLAGSTADQDLDADASVPPIQVYHLDDMHHAQHHGQNQGHQQQGHPHAHGHQKHQEPYNVYLDDIHAHKGQSKVDRIVTDLYNPDYYEPIRVLDYRYLKSGGRDYTRDAGGQILILPKNVRINQKKEFSNYDELLEFLRLKQLAELEAHKLEMSKLGYERRHNDYYEQRVEVNSRHQHSQHDQRNYYRQGEYGGAYKRGAQVPSQEAESVVKSEEDSKE